MPLDPSKPFFYHVCLRCEYGPELGTKRIADCMVVAKNGTEARKRIIEFVAEQNRIPRPEDGTELSYDEQHHVHQNWPRWVVDTIEVGEPIISPESKDIWWDNWVEIPPPEGQPAP